MNCPMTFSDQRSGTEHDCVREECAWWVVKFASIGKRMPDAVGCAVAFIAANGMKPVGEWLKAYEHEERTCHMTHDESASRAMCGPVVRCSACGACVPEVGPINFCPSCRAKVVSE